MLFNPIYLKFRVSRYYICKCERGKELTMVFCINVHITPSGSEKITRMVIEILAHIYSCHIHCVPMHECEIIHSLCVLMH